MVKALNRRGLISGDSSDVGDTAYDAARPVLCCYGARRAMPMNFPVRLSPPGLLAAFPQASADRYNAADPSPLLPILAACRLCSAIPPPRRVFASPLHACAMAPPFPPFPPSHLGVAGNWGILGVLVSSYPASAWTG
jgi:hypothetical protein